jgi:hypothetical protein
VTHDDPDGWRPYCDDEMLSYEYETDPDDWRSYSDEEETDTDG